MHGHCVACIIPTFHRSKEGELHANLEWQDHNARTGIKSLCLRKKYQAKPDKKALQELNNQDYHSLDLFTDDVPLQECSIYDAIVPDLLHQASKNFHDQIFDK